MLLAITHNFARSQHIVIISVLSIVLTFANYIDEVCIKINESLVFRVNKRKKPVISLTRESSAFQINSLSNLLVLDSYLQTEQTFSIEAGPSITLMHIDVRATVNIDDDFREQIKRILKKDFPPVIRIQLLYVPDHVSGLSIPLASLNFITLCFKIIREIPSMSSARPDLNLQIFHSLLPLKYHQNEIVPAGLVFIGLGTHQTTGLGMHVFSHFIPTVEREQLDMQDAYLKKWNEEILTVAGQIIRFRYDHLVLDINSMYGSAFAQYATFSFQPSVPNEKIGMQATDTHL